MVSNRLYYLKNTTVIVFKNLIRPNKNQENYGSESVLTIWQRTGLSDCFIGFILCCVCFGVQHLVEISESYFCELYLKSLSKTLDPIGKWKNQETKQICQF